MPRGKYVVIEGHDGTGKSTQVANIRSKLLDRGIKSIEFHEPEDEGTPISSAIRAVIKNGELERDTMTNVLLFSAARHEIWQNRALPALKMGKFVIASRNYFSTLAYQGYGEGFDIKMIETITKYATGYSYMEPDLALILDLNDENERQRRMGHRRSHLRRTNDDRELDKPDTFESRDDSFQTKVRLGYLAIAKERNLVVVSARPEPDIVTEKIWKYIEPLISE